MLVSTCTPDFFYPSTACRIQKKIGAVNAAAFDVNSACTGFITATDIAQKYLERSLQDGTCRSLREAVGQLDYTDRSMCILFGDASGAVVYRKSDKPFYSMLGADGDEFEALLLQDKLRPQLPVLRHEGGREPQDAMFDTESSASTSQSDGHAVYKFAVNAMANAVKNVAARRAATTSTILTSLSRTRLTSVSSRRLPRLGIPEEKVYTNIARMGNVSSACIPVCLDEMRKQGMVKPGQKICFVGFGAGLTYGALIFET